MTDKSQQREMFEDVAVSHFKVPLRDIRENRAPDGSYHNLHVRGLRDFHHGYQAALSQSAVAGAVDVVSVGEIRELAVKEYPGIHPPSAEMRDAFENGFISAVNHLRTASPSQPAAEELCEGCPEIGYPTDETRCTPCPRRASPADDGEMIRLIKWLHLRWTTPMMAGQSAWAPFNETEILATFIQQDKQS